MKTFTASVRHLVIAISTGMIAVGVFAAASFFPETQPTWSPAPFTLQNTDLSAGATKAYRPWFENGAWQGNVIEYDIATDGTRTLGSWTARDVFAAKEAGVVNYWKAAAVDGGRKIITGDGDDAQLAFRWDTLTDTQRELLDPAISADYDPLDATSWDSTKLNYVRGDRSNEKPDGLLRKRYSLLGDIINSRPVYVGAPTSNYTLPGYAAYKNSNINRAGRVYIGANDGMVHAFDASDGHEV
ncbi:MAG: PilC/PilY family type IV pilus protein, partial [Gammaproteobacteria bacterium]